MSADGEAPLRDTLNQYLTKDGALRWGALGSGLIGGMAYAVAQGIISIPLSVGHAAVVFISRLIDAIRVGGGDIVRSIAAAGDVTWNSIDAGILSLPVTVAVILIGLAVVSYAVSEVRS